MTVRKDTSADSAARFLKARWWRERVERLEQRAERQQRAELRRQEAFSAPHIDEHW